MSDAKDKTPHLNASNVEEALKGLRKVCEDADQIQSLLRSITRWEPHLVYLLGQRKQHSTSMDCLSFSTKEGDSFIQVLDNTTEMKIRGNANQFQQLACAILAKYPLQPKIKDV